MARSDPPGGTPGLAVIIHSGKPDVKGGRMSPPGGGAPAGPGQKQTPTPEDITKHNEHCLDCQNYDPQDGSCAKWEGTFDPQDACKEYFTPLSDQEPDADDQGGPSDQDMDDQDSGGGAAA